MPAAPQFTDDLGSLLVHRFDDAIAGNWVATSQPFPGLRSLQLDAPAMERGVTLAGPVDWTRGKFLSVDACCTAGHIGMLQFRFFAKGDPQWRFQAWLGLFPNLPARITLPLAVLDGQSIFLGRTPGRLKGFLQGSRLELSEIDRVELSVRHTLGQEVFCLRNIALLNAEPAYPMPAAPIVDELGQWAAHTWPGKTAGVAQLKENVQAALQAAQAARFPDNWSSYGGDRSKTFRATGYFRTEYDGQRWWLVDPEGCAFFSSGIDCVNSGENASILPGSEPLFGFFPQKGTEFDAAVYPPSRGIQTVSFARANLIRVFGASFQERWAELTRGRMQQWRFNTIGNWSDLSFARDAKLPYVLPMPEYPTTATKLFRDFPDVYAPEFREAARQYAQYLEKFKNDPYLIGYFLRNEPHWAFGKFNVAAEMLEANPGTATRRELAAFIAKKYHGDAQACATAWGVPLKSFSELETGLFRRIGDRSATVYADLWAFSEEMVRTYTRVACEETRRVDPNHLNLGMRYAWISSDLLYAGADFFDVFSLNCYGMEPPTEAVAEVRKRVNKPTLIGEYHFGAIDRGLPATGLKAVPSQDERGVAYRYYFEHCAANPNIIGAHYFQLNDQALLGRFDGENFQIGLVDVCLRPYAELLAAAVQAHEGMYAIRAGQQAPTTRRAEEIKTIGF